MQLACVLQSAMHGVIYKVFVCCLVYAFALLVQPAASQLLGGNDFYASSCPNVESIVRNVARASFSQDATAPAAMCRLAFHDCQVNGCDASILLDSGSDGTAELQAPANLGIRRLDIIDNAKQQVEAQCPGTVSCADILAMVARDAVAFAGGPDIRIPLGRLDGFDTSANLAQSTLPPPSSSADNVLALFGGMGMDPEESVAILGSHTLGVAHCTNFADRLYPVPDPRLTVLMASALQARCPAGAFSNDATANLDTSAVTFDNSYFSNLVNGRGLLDVDANLATDPATASIVLNFANNQDAFFAAFSSAFVKLTSFRVLSGPQGEVRLNCHFSNS
ncbi:hypothetical protein KP509_13G007500 [Ceratopteris richardii]|uniref:Peroxidase n=1 Tax=Ceratopteris richardii TaxID=49495 RepID=A0A8T2TD29_CERRI|nr:hypothetical protein KP509_13G007500 [Ceratopteris richardii]